MSLFISLEISIDLSCVIISFSFNTYLSTISQVIKRLSAGISIFCMLNIIYTTFIIDRSNKLTKSNTGQRNELNGNYIGQKQLFLLFSLIYNKHT